jgi:hypothetical protein
MQNSTVTWIGLREKLDCHPFRTARPLDCHMDWSARKLDCHPFSTARPLDCLTYRIEFILNFHSCESASTAEIKGKGNYLESSLSVSVCSVFGVRFGYVFRFGFYERALHP